jgi:hypothetical protein
MLKRIVVLGLATALIGIPVAIAKNSSSPSPQKTPAVKPAALKQPGQKSPAQAKARDKAYSEHDGRQCPDDATTDADL